MTLICYFLALAGLVLLAWYLFLRARGDWRFWIRATVQPEALVLGQSLPFKATSDQIAAAIREASAAARSLDQRATTTVRQWDQERGTVFVGVSLREEPGAPLPDGFQLQRQEAHPVLRISGQNRRDEDPRRVVLDEWFAKSAIEIDRQQETLLRGQSFELSQWPQTAGPEDHSTWSRLNERIFQLRDNLVLPIIGMLAATGLLGTKQPFLFALGILLIVFLSGVCKFVFIHQREDEAEEGHLQNY